MNEVTLRWYPVSLADVSGKFLNDIVLRQSSPGLLLSFLLGLSLFYSF